MAARVQKRVFGQSSGRHKPHDFATDDGFITTFFRLGRGLHLLANSDAETLADQGQEISLGRVVRHAAHRDFIALVFAAFGERDVQSLGRRDRVVKEHLIEIPHPVKQQSVRMRGFDL